eukprot:scaffold1214_cov136-Isochrysis_galbana.AAC.1
MAPACRQPPVGPTHPDTHLVFAGGVLLSGVVFATGERLFEAELAGALPVRHLGRRHHSLLLLVHAEASRPLPVSRGDGVGQPLLAASLLSCVHFGGLRLVHHQTACLAVVASRLVVGQPLEPRRLVARVFVRRNRRRLFVGDGVLERLLVLAALLVEAEPLEPRRLLVSLDRCLRLQRLGQLPGAHVVALGHLCRNLDLLHLCKLLVCDCPFSRLDHILGVTRPLEPLDALRLLGLVNARVVGVLDAHAQRLVVLARREVVIEPLLARVLHVDRARRAGPTLSVERLDLGHLLLGHVQVLGHGNVAGRQG